MSNIDFTATSLAEPALSPVDDDDPDCSTLKEFRLDLISSVISDLHLMANLLTDLPEDNDLLPVDTWATLCRAFDQLSRATQNLRN